MDIYQIKTFVTVAREGSITRAAGLLHLSQPAVSAHIKAMEDALGLSLFERTPRGMSLTRDGQRLLAKAEQTLASHQELMAEATRTKSELSGRLRLGAGSNSNAAAIDRLLTVFSARYPGVEVVLEHGSSRELLAGIRNGRLDAGFYNEPGEAEADLATIDVAQFAIYLVAAPGVLAPEQRTDWKALAALPWIYPTASACCGRTAAKLFAAHGFEPVRVISADRQDITKTLVASGLGVGLLHADTARAAQRDGEVELLVEAEPRVRVLFAQLGSREQDPILAAAASILRAAPTD
jgi:DNA-binding transcriptional LysR family regulator